MVNLAAFVHVSTAYSNCQRSYIEEKVYELGHDPEWVLAAYKTMSKEQSGHLIEKLFEGHPNTYTYTKALAEHYVAKAAAQLPAVIVRPSIVMPSYREPAPGWVDSFNGPSGLVIAGGLGILHVCNMEDEIVSDFVPVDLVANACIAAAWKLGKSHSPGDPLIVYNFTSGSLNPTTWDQYLNGARRGVERAPSSRTLRQPADFPQRFIRQEWIVVLKQFIYHWLFALIIDSLLKASGKKAR